ncbi:MAG: RNA methyltransferase [Chitinophagaceae bacterium]|nr:RNA methyltransferase [Chitinophagaceae bacterium]
MRKLSMDELNRKTIEEFRGAEKLPIIVVLENVRSAYNVGSVLRTADAFLLQAVYTTGYTPHPPHKQIDKTALGAHESVHCKHFEDTKSAIAELKADGFTVYAAEQAQQSILLHQLKAVDEQKIAVVLGNEVSGVEQDTIHLCDGCIEIPQFGMKHSLNISVAAGVLLWEFVKSSFMKLNDKSTVE